MKHYHSTQRGRMNRQLGNHDRSLQNLERARQEQIKQPASSLDLGQHAVIAMYAWDTANLGAGKAPLPRHLRAQRAVMAAELVAKQAELSAPSMEEAVSGATAMPPNGLAFEYQLEEAM